MIRYHPWRAWLRGAFVLAATAGIWLPAAAGPGHDHGDEAPAAARGSASPRFAAVSESFELVGVLNGKQLTLYLDRADTNAPVENAKLDIEFGGVALKIEAHGPGEFIAMLAEPPKPGIVAVTATVIAGQDTDLLAGELDLHDSRHESKLALADDWKRYIPAAVGGGVVFALVALGTMWLRRRKSTFSVRTGGVK